MPPTLSAEVACFCGPPRHGCVLCGGWWKFWSNRKDDAKDAKDAKDANKDGKEEAGRDQTVVVNVVSDKFSPALPVANT